MRTFLRVVAGLNAVFQGLLGVLSMASPTVLQAILVVAVAANLRRAPAGPTTSRAA